MDVASRGVVSFDTLAPFATNASGTGQLTANVPNVSSLIGLEFHQQILVLDLGANALGITWTNGGSGKMGA